jgi:hypothetical protein
MDVEGHRHNIGHRHNMEQNLINISHIVYEGYNIDIQHRLDFEN